MYLSLCPPRAVCMPLRFHEEESSLFPQVASQSSTQNCLALHLQLLPQYPCLSCCALGPLPHTGPALLPDLLF